MGQPQKGICAEPNLHAQFLMYNILDDDAQAMRAKLARVLEVFDYFDDEHYEAMVSGVIAVGVQYWSELYPGTQPKELTPFPDIEVADRSAPSQAYDLFIQIRADRLDIVHAIAVEVHQLLSIHVELIEDTRAFRYLDGRDLNGFILADDNPRGPERREVGVVGDYDPYFAGGSYVHVQRFRNDLQRWQLLSEKRQEQIMGRQKEHNLPTHEANLSSHYTRTRLTDLPGVEAHARQLRHSMPYANMQVQGEYFVSCCHSPRPFKAMLHSMYYGAGDGDYDAWLDYTNAEMGGAFFAPSIDFILANAT